MIFQTELLQILADIVATILNFLRPVVSPMGSLMVSWMEVVLNYFPFGNLMPYIIAFVIILLLAGIVNILWPGDKPPVFIDKLKKKVKIEEEIVEEVEAEVEEVVEEIEAEAEEVEEEIVEEVEAEVEEVEELVEEVEVEAEEVEEEIVEEVEAEVEEVVEEIEAEAEEVEAEEIDPEERLKSWLNQLKTYRKPIE